MDELKLFQGDTVLLKGKMRKQSVAIVLAAEVNRKNDDGKIQMNKCLRSNLRCKLGDMVFVKPSPDIPNAKKIHVLPFADNFVLNHTDTAAPVSGHKPSIVQDSETLVKQYLMPYFKDSFRPIHKGDTILI